MHIRNLFQIFALALLSVHFLAGCAAGPNKADPWEKTNRAFYKFDDGLDHYVLTPLSDGYVKTIPLPLRDNLRNAFSNLGYGNVILNDFLQANWNQGWSDAGRMAINSTIGLGGLYDLAGPWGLPSHDNDFGITLGKWNLACGGDGGPGPYLMLPLFGPSCIRDVPAIPVQIVTDPITWVNPPLTVTIPLNVVRAIDARTNASIGIRFRDQAALDPYVFTRDAYLQFRLAQIQEGKAPSNNNMYDEDTAPDSRPATQPATQPATTPNP